MMNKLSEEEESVTTSVRLTLSQREKLMGFGGGKWIRQKIDETESVKSDIVIDHGAEHGDV